MQAKIVVDLGFGDSGKGAAVDSLCIGETRAIVVRFSGGQQCGHNVCIDKKLNHIHSSYGSGTLRGVPSYFTEHTTMYLNSIVNELDVLKSKGINNPKLIFHPLAKVTTPYDVAYNRINSQYTTDGTTGLGVGATMNRHLNTGYKLHVIDLFHKDIFQIKMEAISQYYEKLIGNPRIVNLFRKEVDKRMDYFYQNLNIVESLFQISDYEYLREYEVLIFEGSQGILLDMDHGTFPNVTYANTTSKNALEICKKLDILEHTIEMFYVTRAYLTRHGNGWLPEGEEVKLINNEDEINVTNQWQGNFKTRPFNIGLINYSLDIDKIYSNHGDITKNLIISCCDQLKTPITFDRSEINDVIDNIIFRSSPISKPIWEGFQKY